MPNLCKTVLINEKCYFSVISILILFILYELGLGAGFKIYAEFWNSLIFKLCKFIQNKAKNAIAVSSWYDYDSVKNILIGQLVRAWKLVHRISKLISYVFNCKFIEFQWKLYFFVISSTDFASLLFYRW